jgi:hypothetical protein
MKARALITSIAALFLATAAMSTSMADPASLSNPFEPCASYSGMKLRQCIAKETDLIELPPKYRRKVPPYKKATDVPYDPHRPPPEFDHAFKGTVEIRESADPCSNGNMFTLGCTTYIQSEPYPLCHIEMLKRRMIEAMGGKYDDVLRHEIGHCNGWKHRH